MGTNLANGSSCPMTGSNDCQRSCQDVGTFGVSDCVPLPANALSACADQEGNPCAVAGRSGAGLCDQRAAELPAGTACDVDDGNPCDEMCLDHDGDSLTANRCASIASHGFAWGGTGSLAFLECIEVGGVGAQAKPRVAAKLLQRRGPTRAPS